MGDYILCQTRRAEKPFYLQPVRLNIYSVEELCYFLVNDLYLVDSSVFCEGLAEWLENEAGLSKLAVRLRPKLSRYTDIQELIYPVLKEINYLTYDEMKKFSAAIQVYHNESACMRERKKGDSLARNGILADAIQVYQDLIHRIEKAEPGREIPESDFSLIPVLYHNLGCAFSRLFQMEKAAECFWEAYRWTGSNEDLCTYMLAYRSINTPLEYQSRLAELGVEEEVRKEINDRLDDFRRRPERQVYIQDIDEILTKLTEEYHRSTGS